MFGKFLPSGDSNPEPSSRQRVAVSTILHRQTPVVVVVDVVKKVVDMARYLLCRTVVMNVMVVLMAGVSVIYVSHDIVYPVLSPV
jgi:ABC-type antimicrobial peptide transport system ATPase subunit